MGLILQGMVLGVAMLIPCALGAWGLTQAAKALAAGAARPWSMKLGGIAGYIGAFAGTIALGGQTPEIHSLLAPLGFLGMGAGAWVGTKLSERRLRLASGGAA